MKNGVYFIVHNSIVFQGFDLCKLDDLLDKKDLLNSITKYGTSLQTLKSTGLKFCKVDLLQELHIVV